MSLPLRSPAARVAAGGLLYAAAAAILLGARFPLGSPGFFLVVAMATAAWALILSIDGRQVAADPAGRRLFLIAAALAVAVRIPLAVAPVDASSDMVRYLWDGRVQTLGLNPYAVLPADPALAWTHTAESAQMPSLRAQTPYAPAAQLFFRLVVSVRDSTRAMKAALVACDLLTFLVLWRWLLMTGRPPWLALAYAWHPLVVFEVAHSGHVDALGALWVMASLYWLSTRRPRLAVVAFVLALATKPLPVVLAPLFIGRVRWRDLAAGGALLALLYLPFARGGVLPFGAVPNVVAYIRFNGPAFDVLATLGSPRVAAAVAVLAGLAAAAWARRRLAGDDPAAWAWPMAIALAGAPVVYPWYALYFVPFLTSGRTAALRVWSITGFGAYAVWHASRMGGRWIVPLWIEAIEYGLPLLVALVWLHRGRAGGRGAESTLPPPA